MVLGFDFPEDRQRSKVLSQIRLGELSMIRSLLKAASAIVLGLMTVTGIGASANVSLQAAGSQADSAAIATGTNNSLLACTYHNSQSARVPCSTCGVRG
jgi:hypothetical protein